MRTKVWNWKICLSLMDALFSWSSSYSPQVVFFFLYYIYNLSTYHPTAMSYQSYVSIAGSWSGVFAEDGRICQEGLGACGNLVGEDCNERCRVKHLGGKADGICDMSVRTPLCVCYFNCTPPICVADLGFQQQYNFCKEKCESTYGGLLLNSSCGEEASDGSCHCQCQYICG